MTSRQRAYTIVHQNGSTEVIIDTGTAMVVVSGLLPKFMETRTMVKITWNTSGSVTLDMDSVEYTHLLMSLVLLQLSVNRPQLLPLLDRLYAELYDGMDGRDDAKQKERGLE